MTSHRIGTREEWLAASAELLKREKELTRMGDELARQRRELPRRIPQPVTRAGGDHGELGCGRGQRL